jgi:CSLREA domain-containing protein
VAAAIGVVALVAGVLGWSAPTAIAVTESDGFYYTNSYWDYGTSPSANDPDHTAYNGGATTITSVYGRVPIYTRFVTLPPQSGQDLVEGKLIEADITVSGVTGATVVNRGTEFDLLCADPGGALAYCDVPAGSYELTLAWRGTAKEGDCRRRALFGEAPDFLPTFEDCPDVVIGGTVTRRVVGGSPNDPGLPIADFSFEVTDAAKNEVTFTNLSSDAKDGTALEYIWDFDDDTDSDEPDPVHEFPARAAYRVTLSVEDSDGNGAAVTKTVDLAQGLVVNSVDDQPAVDADEGCDTGELVDGAPECTLRAAIEAANAAGTGEITFDIPGGGLPSIDTTGTLPELTAPAATIDGTTQDGGWVRVTGGNRKKEHLLVLAGEAQEARGLVVDQVAVAIDVKGEGVTVEGNVVGTDPAGTAAGKASSGVQISGEGAVVTGNLLASDSGVEVGGTATGARIEGNHIGVSRSGAPLGSTGVGVAIAGKQAKVVDNVIRGTFVGVIALTLAPEDANGLNDATGASITGNRIGVSSAGVVLADAGEGVRLDGVADATVANNSIASHRASGISVTGAAEIFSVFDPETEENGIGFYYQAQSDRAGLTVTGGPVTVSGNTVGDQALGAAASGDRPTNGIVVWSGARSVSVRDNTVAGQAEEGILLDGGRDHVVTGNAVGYDAADGEVPAKVGILGTEVRNVALGRTEAGNRVLATDAGVSLTGASDGTIGGNTVAASGSVEESIGIGVPDDAGALKVTSNVVSGFHFGIAVESTSAEVAGNTVSGGEQGIRVSPDEASVTGNSVTETKAFALLVAGEDAKVERNVIGRTTVSGPNVGNAGNGIVIGGSGAEVTRNTVAATGGDGIGMAGGATAELRANRILATAGTPILPSDAPAPPTIAAAIRTTYDGATRTALIVRDLPEEAGRIEVFANASCSGGEAEKVLDVVKEKAEGKTLQLILLKDRPNDDNFTLTFTSADRRTSALSGCQSIAPFADADGDGSQDGLDALAGAEDDPTTAVLLTDLEQLLLVGVEGVDGSPGARLAGVGAEAGPKERPGFLELPFGLIGFTIVGLEPGGSAEVTLAVIDGGILDGEESYWKYGPPSAGAAPTWYPFDYDAATGTGGQHGDLIVLPTGIKRSYTLSFVDGGRGDDDGGANGSIHDPGGFAFVTEEPPPTTTTTAPTTTTTSPTSTTVPTSTTGPTSTTASPSPSSTAVPSPPTGGGPGTPSSGGTSGGSNVDDGDLARTGSDARSPVQVALVLLAGGSVLVLLGRRRRLHQSPG